LDNREPQVSPASALAQHRWHNITDRAAATAPARRAAIAPFEDVVDPYSEMPPRQRLERAKAAFYADLGRKERRSSETPQGSRWRCRMTAPYDTVVAAIVAQAPPLRAEQRARIRALLAPITTPEQRMCKSVDAPTAESSTTR
jgi:hypothetical protein